MENADHAEIVMLGTGSAFPRHSYNTCFILRDRSFTMLVDAGGGIEILSKLQDVAVEPDDIDYMFVSHVHTDHILGAVWVIRSIINRLNYHDGDSHRRLRFFGNADVIETLLTICRMTLLKSNYDRIKDAVEFITVAADDEWHIGDAVIRFFDVGAANVCQTGFTLILPSGRRVVCLGDEAVTRCNMHYACGASWLLCGAYCRYADRDTFHPYEKHHFTVRDVAILAAEAGVNNLVMYHSEDVTGDRRRELYAAEAAEFYHGNIYVPYDGDVIVID